MFGTFRASHRRLKFEIYRIASKFVAILGITVQIPNLPREAKPKYVLVLRIVGSE